MKSPLLTAAFLLTSLLSLAQTSLIFTKGPYREVRYSMGDIITFKIKTHPEGITDQIIGFEDQTIRFRNYTVNVTEITHMYLDKKTKNWWFLKYKYGVLLIFTGTGYLLADWINTGEIQKETAIVSGSMIAGGLLLKVITSKWIKVKGKKKLAIVHI
jgi:hypothetical protein